MSKSSLKKKVLCSLLAASVFGVMYNPGAEASDQAVDQAVVGNGNYLEVTESTERVYGGGQAISTTTSGEEKDASAATGKSDIVVNLNAGAKVGNVFGGGNAEANTNATPASDQGSVEVATSSVTNTGADITLVKGYVGNTFGGGYVYATNFANASSATTGDINITVGSEANVGSVFGNGLAYFTGSANGGLNNLRGLAKVTADNININVDGTVTGIVGGGIAIDDSQSNWINAQTIANTVKINVVSGTVEKIQIANKDNLITNETKYLDDIKKVAGNVAIAGGGLAIGGGAENKVTNAEINVYGGTIDGDILAGGVAVHGDNGIDGVYNGGSYVENSTINLFGGTVKGDIYAGGVSGQFAGTGDPNYVYNAAISKVKDAVINLAGTEVEGKIYGVGYNYAKDSSEKEFDDSVNSTLKVSGENTLTAVSGESKISGFDNINFEENSVTVLKVTDTKVFSNGSTIFINADGTDLSIAASARLDISNILDRSDITIIANADANDDTWSDAQLAYDRTAGYAFKSEVDGDYKVTYKDLSKLSTEEQNAAVNDAVSSFGRFGGSARGIIDGIITNGAATNAGAKEFIGDLTSNGNQAEAEQGLYTGMMLGEDSGVTSNAVSMAQDFADNALLRLSFTQDTVNDDKVGEEGGVWAKYIHNKHEVDGMNSSFGALSSSSDYDGVMVGAELAKKGNMQAGIAFAYGEGDGNGLTTKNDFDMWGISLYGNVKNDDVNIIGDLGFSKSSNEITGKVSGGELNTDRDLNIFTMGVRAEKLYTNGNTQIVPYAGLRYMSVDADSYSTTYKDGKAFDYDAERQDIWTLPVGVSLRNETVTDNGWRITPKLDLAYIWAFGDTDNDVTVNAGSGASVLSYDVMDSGSWLTSVGVDAGKGDWSYGLSYTLQKGSDVENNKWFVNVNYSF